jgi:hypothetical protein
MKLFFTSFLLFSFGFISAQDCFPKEKLPNHIAQLTNFGQRAEFSIDNKTIYFLDKPGGDAWSYSIKTKTVNQITYENNRPKGYGYYRVMALSNGDLILCGGYERHKLFFEIIRKGFKFPPIKIEGEELDEGPAISRKSMKIAWTLPGQLQIYMGEISYTKGKPQITRKKLIVDHTNVRSDEGIVYDDILESQSWRGKNEEELIFAQYKRGDAFRCESMGINIKTKKIINYSKSESSYDEPEGIFPDDNYITVECDKHNIQKNTSTIDIYKLKLDGTGKNMERLTYFSDEPGYRSSNPVISDDGKYMAFQGSYAGSEAGGGCGIYLMDLLHVDKK